MSQAKVEVLGNRKLRTEVYVNGRLAYESANPIPIEKKNIKRLLAMLDGENVEEIEENEEDEEHKTL